MLAGRNVSDRRSKLAWRIPDRRDGRPYGSIAIRLTTPRESAPHRSAIEGRPPVYSNSR